MASYDGPIGSVAIDKAKIATSRQGDSTVLLHVPTNMFVSLNDTGAQIWELIQSGQNSIDAIVDQYAKRSGISDTLAAYQVLSFLDELAAQGFAELQLASGKQNRPLLDVPLDAASLPPGFVPAQTGKRVITIDSPRPNLTIGDARRLAETVSGKTLTEVAKTRVLAVPAPASLDQLAKAAATDFSGGELAVREIASFDRPSEDLRVDNLSALDAASGAAIGGTAGAVVPRMRRNTVVVIVIVANGTVIIIVVSSGGGGGSAGRSRQACKTMCV